MTDRIDGFLHRLDHLSVDDLSMVALGPTDRVERDRLLDEVDAAASAAGRLDEVDDAADRAIAVLVHDFAFRGLEPTWFGLNWGRSLPRSGDRALLFQAVGDAAMAAVVADLVPETAAALSEPFEIATSLAGAAPSVSPSSDGRRGTNVVRALWLVAAFLVIGAVLAGIEAAITEVLIRIDCCLLT
jgi:hypothetical protein